MNQVQGLRLDARVDWEIAAELIALIASTATNEVFKSEWSAAFDEKATEALYDLSKEWADQGSASQEGGGAALWRAIAALSVCSAALAEQLSSGAKFQHSDGGAPLEKVCCSNHDDGVTAAVFRCLACGPEVALCAQCDTCLHLPRAARGHNRTVIQQQDVNLNVSINDGNARIKTQFGVLAVDRHNGKAVCELKTGTQLSAGGAMLCRFCQSQVPDGALEVAEIEGVCGSDACRRHAETACTKKLECGHECGGIRDEETCLPCLRCADADGLFVDADDFCSICWTDNLGAAPCVAMECGHVFHSACVHAMIDRRWPGPSITFSFADCPCCKAAVRPTSTFFSLATHFLTQI
jgi:E3 ubiquitin-protein ligase MYCBP2